MNDSNRYEGPGDGDYASYVQKLGAPDRAQPSAAAPEPQAESQKSRIGSHEGADRTDAGGGGVPASPAAQQAEPPARAPRFIGLLLIIAAWVLFFVALWLGIQAWHARSGHMDAWLPAGFALIAARLLLAMGKAARNPRMRPQDPKKSFPEHIEY